MVKYLKRLSMRMKSIISVSFIAIMVTPCSVFSASGELIDPTMSSSMEMATRGLNTGAMAMTMAEPVLQSVLLSSSRKLAVISGKTYNVGDKVGEATLLKVSEYEAVLRNSDSTLQTLNMYPAIMKKMVVQSARTVQ